MRDGQGSPWQPAVTTVTDYTASPTIARFMCSDAPVRLALGPVGGGKSVGCLMEIARRAKAQAPNRQGLRKTRWVIVRQTYQQLKDTTLKSWTDWFPDGVAGRWREYDKTFFLEFEDVRAEVLFRALDDPDDVARLLSLELTGGYINEARETPLEIVTALRSRLGRYPSRKEGGPTWHGLIMDTNPPDTDHWIYQKFEEEKPTGWEIFKQPSGLSPEAENLENLPENYYQDMMEGASEDWINVHVRAQYGRSKSGRPVYIDSWKHDFHTRTGLQVMTDTALVIGLDAGRTPAASFFQMDPKGRVLLLDELTSENMGMENFLTRKVKPLIVKRYVGIPAVVSADPAVWQKSQLNERSVADIIRDAGFTLPKPRGPAMGNRIEPRLRAVETLLNRQIDGEAAFLVDRERCPFSVAGFEHGYHYKMKRDGTAEVTPEKNEYSHVHDSIQYGAQLVEFGTDYATAKPASRKVDPVDMRGWT